MNRQPGGNQLGLAGLQPQRAGDAGAQVKAGGTLGRIVRQRKLAAQARIVHVIGTTGLSADDEARIEAAARHAVIVKSGNMSVGVNLLAALVRQAARALDPSFDIEVIEMHHRLKKDAPSGTAARLLEILLEERKLERSALVNGRKGITGERKRAEIGVHALRGGDVIGDHTVMFAGAGERLELTHRASDREIFARGALRAAQWVVAQKPGVYDMQDVLGLT